MDCRRVWRTNALYVVPYIHLIVRHFRCKIPLPPPPNNNENIKQQQQQQLQH